MNKLVRDKIIEIIKADGKSVNFEVLDDAQYLRALKNKLQEESLEVINSSSPEETLAELADLQELIDCLLPVLNFSKKDLKSAQKIKNKKRGSFKKRLFLKD